MFEMPAMRMVVTAPCAEVSICPPCGGKTTGALPAGRTQAVHYGPTVKTWAASFPTPHHRPVERTAPICADLGHQPVSEATVWQAAEDLAQCLEPSTDAVQARWRSSAVLHGEESGRRVKGKLHGLPVASAVHTKRGHEGMEAAGILGTCTGTAVHAPWTPSCTDAECRHARCHAHHLRALPCIETQFKQAWANDMAEWRLESKTAVEDRRAQAARLPPEWLAACARR